VSADSLFAAPEMALRHVGEVEVRREGFDEGQPHGFDGVDASALASRTIVLDEPASEVMAWLVERLTSLGWIDAGDGRLTRDLGESILIRVERDRGQSRVARLINSTTDAAKQDAFERAYFGPAAADSTVVTVFFGVVRD
jgi:hypothetical protein